MGLSFASLDGSVPIAGTADGPRRERQDAQVAHHAAQPVAAVLHLGLPVGPRLLRHRDGRRPRLAPLRRHAPRRHPAAGQPPPGRPRLHLGHGHRQDGAGHPAALRPDARPEVRDLDGLVRQLRRPVLGQLLGHQGRRPDHPRRRVRARLPAPARGAARGHRAAPGADPARGHRCPLARRPHCRQLRGRQCRTPPLTSPPRTSRPRTSCGRP